MLFPKRTKYKKQFKGKLVGQITQNNKILYGNYAIKSLEEARITARQIEAIRRNIIRKMKRLGFLWIRIYPDTPVSAKPSENRMGKGKGNISFWAARVKKGQIICEISGVSFENAKNFLTSASKKLPIKTKFIFK